MKLHEYEARDLFENQRIPIPPGRLCRTPEEVREFARSVSRPVVVKAQVLVAGRGKAGGIKKAGSADEAYEVAKVLLGSEIKGIRVSSVLAVEAITAKKELYLGFTVDRARRKIAMIASAEGGMDLEELAATRREKILREEVDPVMGLYDYQVRNVASSLGLLGRTAASFGSICRGLFGIFVSQEADLAESNPLAVREDGSLIALDSRITLDDNAIFRHPQYKHADEELTPLERAAVEEGLAFVQLDGDIGIIGNGAGLVMTTLDVVAHYGGRPANFLDMGGGSNEELVYKAVRLVLGEENLKVVFVNILGGITKCDEVARGLVRAIRDSRAKVPFIVRMVGTNEEEGRRILQEAGISYLDSMETAAEAAVRTASAAGRTR